MNKITFLKPALSLLPIALLAFSQMASADPISFTDGFEGMSIDNFWTSSISAGGSISLTNALSHTGVQSLAISNVLGPPDRSNVTHDFGMADFGLVSVWIYDSGPHAPLTAPIPNLWAGTGAIGTTSGFDMNMDGASYTAFDPVTGVYTGVGARSVGWHEFTMNFSATETDLLIDGVTVLTQAGANPFSLVSLDSVYAGTTYFDDFSVTHGSAVPEPTGLASLAGSLVGLLWCLRRRA